jgi:hypothetical protein
VVLARKINAFFFEIFEKVMSAPMNYIIFPLHSMTRLLIWLHGNSILKIGCHYFWPGLIIIALPKNTLPSFLPCLKPKKLN